MLRSPRWTALGKAAVPKRIQAANKEGRPGRSEQRIQAANKEGRPGRSEQRIQAANKEGRPGHSEPTCLLLGNLEHRVGIEPTNTGFADQRVSHFATGARLRMEAHCVSTQTAQG